MFVVRRQPLPGLIDKSPKGRRARLVPIIAEIRPLVRTRLDVITDDPMARLFTGPRSGRITTAVLRDATHWDEVVARTGLCVPATPQPAPRGADMTADASLPVHVLQKIAGHGSLATTQLYLHPDERSIEEAARHSAPTWEPARGVGAPQVVPMAKLV